MKRAQPYLWMTALWVCLATRAWAQEAPANNNVELEDEGSAQEALPTAPVVLPVLVPVPVDGAANSDTAGAAPPAPSVPPVPPAPGAPPASSVTPSTIPTGAPPSPPGAAARSTTPAADPPGRVGRLSLLSGTVLLKAAGGSDWVEALQNRPVTAGDTVWADAGSHAEVHAGTLAFRLSGRTVALFASLDDGAVAVHVGQGSLALRVREIDAQGSLLVHAANATVSLRALGSYRINVDPASGATQVVVRDGAANVSCGSRAFEVRSGQSARLAGEPCGNTVEALPPQDAFDAFCAERDARDEHPQALQYVSRGMVGYEDLDGHGAWQTDPEYGAMWMPSGMAAGWAPYHFGRWTYVMPWGWTWVDDAPWGFAPFHYGRWIYSRGGWGWLPGGMVARPCYAPALVAFVGGGTGAVAWFALGPRDVYMPGYRVSPVYTRRINYWELRGRNPVTLGARGPYVNRGVPGAIVSVPASALRGGRRIGPAIRGTPPAGVRRGPVAGFSPSIAPPPRYGGGAVRPTPAFRPVPALRPAPAFHPYRAPTRMPTRPAFRPGPNLPAMRGTFGGTRR